MSNVARPQPPIADGLRKRADQVGLACGDRPLQHYFLAAPDEPAGREFGRPHSIEAAALEEVTLTFWLAIIYLATIVHCGH